MWSIELSLLSAIASESEDRQAPGLSRRIGVYLLDTAVE